MRIYEKDRVSLGTVSEDLDASHLYEGPEDEIPDYDDYSLAGVDGGTKWEIKQIPETDYYNWYVTAAGDTLAGGPSSLESAKSSVDRARFVLGC